jgi:hypothetical protein
MILPDVCKAVAGRPRADSGPNIVLLSQGSGGTFSSQVLIGGDKTATTKSEISMSSGDEAGTAGGFFRTASRARPSSRRGARR